MGNNYRMAPEFQQLAQEHPELVHRVTDALAHVARELSQRESHKGKTNENEITPRDLQELLNPTDLYEAYRLMRSYGATDTEILR